MSARTQLVLRLGAIVLVAVTVQLAAVPQITVLGVAADLSPLVVVAIGLLCGSVSGALTGFCVGLLIDMALLQTLGISSLVYTGVGYLAGRMGESTQPSNDLVPLAAGAAATAFAQVGYTLLYFLLGVEGPVSLLLVRQILATILINTILALPVYALVRRVLAPALPDTGRRQRSRRSSVRPGLSPLQGGSR